MITAWFSLPNEPVTEVAHHTTAHANCAFHRSIRLQAPLAIPRNADTTAMKTCTSPKRPEIPNAGNSSTMETPSPSQIDPIARPSVVSGCFSWLRLTPIHLPHVHAIAITTNAAATHTGHASIVCEPHADQAIATKYVTPHNTLVQLQCAVVLRPSAIMFSIRLNLSLRSCSSN